MRKVHLHIEADRDLNNRIKKLVISEESRTGKRAYMKNKILECLEAGVAFKEKQERE